MLDAWSNLSRRLSELDALAGTSGLLEWDQQTGMPPGGAASRGQQAAVIGSLMHERFTAPEVGQWLGALEQSPLDAVQAAAVRKQRRNYRRATMLPTRLVEDLAIARSEGFSAWMKAREADDFGPFEKPLQRLIGLSREAAERTAGPQTAHLYDELLEEYDPGSRVAELAPMFTRLSAGLGELLAAVERRGAQAGPQAVELELDDAGVRTLSRRVIRDLGFDLSRGRLDLSEHPFTCGLSVDDVRLTMKLNRKNPLGALAGTIHECGHGMYEQGLPKHLSGTGLDKAAGMGLHESQSRFWENFIGRSLPFCAYLLPRMQGIWPDLALTPAQLFASQNRIERSLIRVHADEATYNLHIVVRFELEVAMLEGRLQAADLPAAWDAAYEKHLGVRAPSARQGVLQDIHWSSGLLGYFPSYTIGNLYAASLGACVQQEIPDLWGQVARGEFGPVLAWLREKIHQHGHTTDAPEIFKAAVGDRDPVADLLDHLWSRQGRLYGVER